MHLNGWRYQVQRHQSQYQAPKFKSWLGKNVGQAIEKTKTKHPLLFALPTASFRAMTRGVEVCYSQGRNFYIERKLKDVIDAVRN